MKLYRIYRTTFKTWTCEKLDDSGDEYYLSRKDNGEINCSCLFGSLRPSLSKNCKHVNMLIEHLLENKEFFET